jgi:hypothetical protein
MRLKIEVSDEIADQIALEVLSQSISYLKQDVRNLKANKNKEDYQLRDMLYGMEILEALEKVYNYYGGNLR